MNRERVPGVSNLCWSRRDWLYASLGGCTLAQLACQAQVSPSGGQMRPGMPGLHPGEVVSVHHAGSIVNGRYQAEAVRAMIDRGMRELTGAPDAPSAWKQFFERGDVVGIKVNPVGGPLAISSPEVLRTIIEGVRATGVPARDIVVYDRYRDQFLACGFDKWLPEGVRWTAAVAQFDSVQQGIEGYDPDHYMDMAVTLPGQDSASLTARRSYAARFITREVNKLINLPVLKDHQSAGVTLALKNLSHGLVNNVSRSHSSKTLNVCGAFIPAVVSMPVIRAKTVLHILDGIKGVYHGGPFARAEFVWEHQTMYFATDPVALDHIGWKEIDKKRISVGRKPLLEDPPDAFSTFVRRQPEHVEIAGALGLGVWEESKIRHRSYTLTA